MLTKRQLEILRQMADAYGREDFLEAEIACEGISCWLGYERISIRTLKAFVDHIVVSRIDTSGNGMYLSLSGYWEINSTGMAVTRRPELADEVWLRVRNGKPFTIKDDRICDLETFQKKRRKKIL